MRSWRKAGAGDTVTIPSMISTLLPSGHSISSQNRTRSSQLCSGSWLTVSALMAVSFGASPSTASRNGTGGVPPPRSPYRGKRRRGDPYQLHGGWGYGLAGGRGGGGA